MKRIRPLAALTLSASLVLAASSVLADETIKLSNKWRIEVSESAKTDGNIVFRITPKDGTPVDATVAIVKGRSENHVAQDIRDALKVTLDQKVFKVEVDDGEDVLVKRHKGPDFEVKLVQSTVEGVRIHVEKE